MPRKPRAGSRAWEESVTNSPEYARQVIQSLAQRAETGNAEAVTNLLAWLERFPEMRSLVRSLDELATKVERAWVQRITGGNVLSQKALEDELARLKTELLGLNPSAADRVLATTFLVDYLAYHRAALATSAATESVELRIAHERLLSLAQKRLRESLKAMELHRGARTRGNPLPKKLKIFEPKSCGV